MKTGVSPCLLLGLVFILGATPNALSSDCGYRKFKIFRKWWCPRLSAIVTGIVAEMITLGLGNVREQALCWKGGALFDERMRRW